MIISKNLTPNWQRFAFGAQNRCRTPSIAAAARRDDAKIVRDMHNSSISLQSDRHFDHLSGELIAD
jgi:hypothetical protein